MVVTLLRLEKDTVINIEKIVQITIENLNKLRQERGQNYQTPEQRQRLDNRFWEVSVYLRSGSDGYNPQRWTKRFMTESEAQNFVTTKFGGCIVNNC